MSEPGVLATDDALRLLSGGELELEGRLVDASNATLYGTVSLDGASATCVYKPRAGERPLWDFPDGTLAQREAAAYLVSAAAGWDVVPPTVLRDGPFGEGMCQLWIDTDESVELVDIVPRGRLEPGWLPVVDAEGPRGRPVTLAHADDPRLARLAVFDAVVNNADRKGGHILPDAAGRVFGIDHGISFHVEDKLRTVLWGWAGQPIAPEHVEVLCRLREDLLGAGPLLQGLSALLTRAEVRTTTDRVRALADAASYPLPGDGWPSIPWPPF